MGRSNPEQIFDRDLALSSKSPRIGIIGGAGPMAGALLFHKIMEICQKLYGCKRDMDFPHAVLLNYPFADMFGTEKDIELLKGQLNECFDYLSRDGVSIVAIACNTLHCFLEPQPKQVQLIHMIQETGIFLEKMRWTSPLVLSTLTSAQTRLHEQFFPCRYPDPPVQKMIDTVIQDLLAGSSFQDAAIQLNALVDDGPIVLGCTELSLLHEKIPLNFQQICDPNVIVAEKICRLVYNR